MFWDDDETDQLMAFALYIITAAAMIATTLYFLCLIVLE